MKKILSSIEAEYRRYKALADAAMEQLTEAQLNDQDSAAGNSVAIVAWHIAGNLRSRFTEFLVADGEKPWRNREKEFARDRRTRHELTEHWELGWQALFQSLSELTDEHIPQTVVIRGTELKVHEALLRSLAHTCYHVGQIVYVAKALRGPDWEYLSIPPGESEAYNQNPTGERAEAHAEAVVEYYNVDPDDVLSDISKQENLFYGVFPGQIDVGSKKPTAFDWMLSRIVDSSGENVPRELIHLLTTARSIQLKRNRCRHT